MRYLITILLTILCLNVHAQFIANGGNDTTITTNTYNLVGNASGDANVPLRWNWVKTAGPKKGKVVNNNSQNTSAINLIAGVYTFRVIAIDNSVKHYKSVPAFVNVTVTSGGGSLQANAGSDQTVSRFQGYASLDGSSSTGAITAYNWSLDSGVIEDGVAYIDNVSGQSTTTHLMPYGNYKYQLSVTSSTITKTLATDEIYQPCSYLVLNNVTSLTTGMTVFGNFIRGNTTVTGIDVDTVFLSNPIIYPVYTNDVFTFATGSGDLSKDTAYVVVSWGAPPPQRNSWHRVSSGTLATDRTTCPFCNIGDFIIDGANDGYNLAGGNKSDIYIPTTTFAGQAPGTTIFIKGGVYGDINFDLNDAELTGTPSSPIIITNYAGQVEAKRIRLNNIQYVHVTSKYVNGVSGDPNYKGWDSSYSFPEKTFGFYANNGWTSLQPPAFAISGASKAVEVDYVEGGEGAFCGFWCKENPQGGEPNYDSIHIHQCYFHDTGGEGWYFGLTDGDSPSPAPNQFNFCQFDNNVNTRTGNEIYQIGQLGSNNYFHNNVGAMSATRWRSPFEESQYFGGQFGIRNGKNYIDSNIILGSGEQTLSAIAYAKAGLTYDGGTLTFRADAFEYSKGFIGNYLQGIDGATIIGMPILFDSCVFGNSYFQEDSVFRPFYPPAYTTPQPNFTNTQQVLRSATDSNLVIMRKSYRDGTKTILIANAATIDTSGTTAVSQLPVFDWNSGFDTSNMRTYSMWGNWIFAGMGDEFTNQTDFRQGQKNIFQTGQMVMNLGKYFTSKIDNNWNHFPTTTDSYWQQLTWTDNGNTVSYPPDNYLLSTSNFYQIRGMGLTQHQ